MTVSLQSAVSDLAREVRSPEIPHAPAANPTYVVERRGRWAALDLRELWAHRELLYILAMRDISVRYKQTVLGAAWAVLQPFLAMLVFAVFFGKLAKMPSDGVPYPIFAYAGLLPWTFFANAITESTNSVVGNSALITKVYFPRAIIPGAAVAAGLVDFVIASVMMFAMMAWYGIAPGAGVLMFLPLSLLIMLTAFAVGLRFSALNAKYRDVRYALPFFVQLWMFLTPVIYPMSIIPAKWQWVIALNPAAGLVSGFRSALLGSPFQWGAIALSTTITLGLLVYSSLAFSRLEREFADIV